MADPPGPSDIHKSLNHAEEAAVRADFPQQQRIARADAGCVTLRRQSDGDDYCSRGRLDPDGD
jgi:hypothetical protein